jgi:deoxyribodipyrimidine photolyase-related protein
MTKHAPPSCLRLVLGDQLSPTITSLADIDRDHDVVLMAEVMGECTYVPHHPKKIAFVLASMRHFAATLRDQGMNVEYVTLEDPSNGGSLKSELERTLKAYPTIERVIVTEPGEWRLLEEFRCWRDALDVQVEIRNDDRFIVDHESFADWAEGRKILRMEEFYRRVRQTTGILMDDQGRPEGGQWNFDKENRKSFKGEVATPTPRQHRPDEITQQVLDLVEKRFGDNFGDVHPFWFAVTMSDAKAAFTKFVKEALPHFGDFQDAMVSGEATMFHSVVSMYMNVGLLDPIQICRDVEAAYRRGDVPINAAEGFVRQVIGWREYVRGIYWLHMPAYGKTNTFDANRPLPDFYWGADTDMNCIKECVAQTGKEAYAHHIQRLMVTGNFALLAGVNPLEVQEWYLAVYADAFEWVEMPNTHGMALFADEGLMATKPYAAGGRYINKMSDYCGSCKYDPTDAVGENACPFSYLYWDFLIRNRSKLEDNHRLRTVYSSLARMKLERVEQLRQHAKDFLDAL